MQAAVLADGGESFLLNGGGAEFDALQNARVQNIDTGIDAVTDEFDRLLDEAVDS